MPMLPWGKRHEAVKRAEEILAECCQNLGLGEKKLSKSGREWVARRSWSEDPLEMTRIIYYAALVSGGDAIEAGHFPLRMKADCEAFAKAQFDGLALEEVVRQKISHFFERLGTVEARDVHHAVISQVERPLVVESLKWAGGNQLKAARVLGLNRNTLRKKIRDLGVKKP